LGFIEIPEVKKIHGEEAIQVLQNLITGLEHNKESKLTKRQKRTLIIIAASLIDSIKQEKQSKKGKRATQPFPEQNPFALFRRILPWIPH